MRRRKVRKVLATIKLYSYSYIKPAVANGKRTPDHR